MQRVVDQPELQVRTPVRVVSGDGYQQLKALMPPVQRRGLVLIDPPYENPDEERVIAAAFVEALTRFETGVYALWYPIKKQHDTDLWLARITRGIQQPVVTIEMCVTEPDSAVGLNGSGMLVINPPWQFDVDAAAVAAATARPAGRQVRHPGALVGQRGWPMSNPDRYAVIGHPVHHSRSPFIHARFAAQTGQDISYSTIDATPERFEAAAREFFASGGKGLNVTIPHKEAAARLADELTARAQRAGAVNLMAVRKDGSLLGDNADGAGLVRDLVANHHVDIAGRSILLLGAGGAARGVIAPLLELKPIELTIVNRNLERAHALAQRFADLGPVRATGYDELEARAFDLVINATATSLAGTLPPLPPTVVNAHTTCYDLAYGKDGTTFTRWAQRLGCAQALTGLGMLVEQAAESFQLWRGVRPETAAVLTALAAELRG